MAEYSTTSRVEVREDGEPILEIGFDSDNDSIAITKHATSARMSFVADALPQVIAAFTKLNEEHAHIKSER